MIWPCIRLLSLAEAGDSVYLEIFIHVLRQYRFIWPCIRLLSLAEAGDSVYLEIFIHVLRQY